MLERETESMDHSRSDRFLNFKLILLLTFGQMGPVILSPDFHDISAYFHQRLNDVKLVVTLFFLGFAFGQLIYGVFANRFGRKKTFQWGIAISLVGTGISILSVYVSSFDLLLVGRLLEGLASSSGMVIGFTMLNDLYEEDAKRRILGYSMLAFALLPALATAISGFFVTNFTWQLSLWFLFVYGLFLLFYLSRLPETQPVQNAVTDGSIKSVCASYWSTLANKRLICYSLLYGLSNAGIYVFTTEGPMIGLGSLHLSSSAYGNFAALTFIGTIIGSFLTVTLLNYVSAKASIILTYAIELLAALGMMASFYFLAISKISLFFPIFIWFISNAILVSNAASLATSTTTNKAIASSLMSFIANFMCVLITLALSVITSTSNYLLPIALVVLMLLGSPIILKLKYTE